jgi:hypothetical protein
MHIPTRIYSIKIKLILSCSFHQRQNILLCLRFYLFSFSTLWFSTEQSSLFSCSQSYGHRRHNPQVAGPGLGSSPPTRSAILSGHLLTSSPQSPLALKVPVVCENRGKKHPAKHSARSTLLSFPELTSGTLQKTKQNKKPPLLPPTEAVTWGQGCGLAGRKSSWSLDSLYRFLGCFLAGVSMWAVRGSEESWLVW